VVERLKLYCDLDGVLADFDKAYLTISGGIPHKGDDEFWARIKAAEDFWLNLEMMPDGPKLWDYVKSHHYVVILSSPGTHDTERAVRQKRQWIKKHLGEHVNFVPKEAKFKHHYADDRCILIDDWARNIERWTKAGGIAIHHKSADETIAELQKLGLTHAGVGL